MNAARCLAWCLEYRGNYPDDAITAKHVQDWIAKSALTVAQIPEHKSAVNDAEIWAKTKDLT